MGLMGTPGGRNRMMRGAQNRPATSQGYTGRSNNESGPPDRLRKTSRPVVDFALGLNAFSTKRASTAATTARASEASQSARKKLAIEPHMPGIMRSFRENRVIIVQAATGTGKSIGISEAIAQEGYKLFVTNPRRVGAVQLAEYLASRDGSPLGERFGYRHGRRKEADPDCQVVLTTEGYFLKVMLHQLAAELGPRGRLPEKLAIMWDEAHERTAKGAMLLYLCKEMMRKGHDVKLVISSATLNPAPLVEYFANEGIDVPVHSIPVKHYPISAVARKKNGTVIDDICGSERSLTFVYGKGPIAALTRELALADPGLKVIPMHAELSDQEQQESLKQINHGKGRIAVIATNNLQASVTLDIDRVISTGLVRRERVGVDFEKHLTIEASSRAEEKQRRGRAGRLRPGEWSYHGETPLEKLAAEVPHEIRNCQLESLVLQTIAAKRSFSRLNQKLLFKAPERNIERAVQNLYNLDLIGPRGDITRLGEAVAELPTEVRTGKALALASKYSEKLGLPPEALVIPTIDMVACIEAKGIVTWESVSAASHGEASDYNKSRGRWKKLLNRTHNSDPVAQMEIFRSIMRLRPEHFKDWGIHLNHFHAAMSIRERICEALDIDPSTAPSRTLSAEQLRKIKEFHWAGSIDRLYRFVRRDAEDSNKREFKPVVSEGRLRFLSRDSVVTGSKFIVAEPLTIDTKYGDDDPMRLLVMASAVDPKWLDKNTPPQLKKSFEAAMDKTRDRKAKADDKPRFRRPVGKNRRR